MSITFLEIQEQANKLFNEGHKRVTVSFPDGEKRNLRLFSDRTEGLCYIIPGKRRRGYPFSSYYLHPTPISIRPIVSIKPEYKKWEDGWKKVRAKLVVSGLWNDIVEEIDIALNLGYDTMLEASREYWDNYNDEDKVEKFVAKYPTLASKNEEGKDYIRCSTVWNYSKLPRVKKMRFSLRNDINDSILQQIKIAMDSKKDYDTGGRTAYDVSFHYDAAKNLATYSEEFKGYGNGHYYISLDATHSLFVEDD